MCSFRAMCIDKQMDMITITRPLPLGCEGNKIVKNFLTSTMQSHAVFSFKTGGQWPSLLRGKDKGSNRQHQGQHTSSTVPSSHHV